MTVQYDSSNNYCKILYLQIQDANATGLDGKYFQRQTLYMCSANLKNMQLNQLIAVSPNIVL